MKKGAFLTDYDLDERQLLIRGNVFKHITILLFALILSNAMLKDFGITWAEGRNENLLIFWAGVTLGLCEFTLRDITPANGRMNILYVFYGLCGAVMAAMSLLHILGQGRPIAANGMLTTVGSGLLQGLCMLLVWVTFFGKRLYARRKAGTDED